MSVTTTSRLVLPPAFGRTLDPEMRGTAHHPAPMPNARPDIHTINTLSNPPDWPSRYRGVPQRKPVNRELDMATRPGGANIAEQIFIATLLNGVRLNANVNNLWRVSGGKVNKTIFRYDIGGEW